MVRALAVRNVRVIRAAATVEMDSDSGGGLVEVTWSKVYDLGQWSGIFLTSGAHGFCRSVPPPILRQPQGSEIALPCSLTEVFWQA